MKNVLVLVALLTGFSSVAQVNPHAIGLRGGSGSYGSGAEISYQHGLGDANRIELDLGWGGNNSIVNNYSRLYVAGIYHWNWNITEGLNWFAGPGAVLGLHSGKNNSVDDGLTLGVGGQVGIEYDFNDLDVPLLLGFDVRPMWRFIGYNSGNAGFGGAFSLRYTF